MKKPLAAALVAAWLAGCSRPVPSTGKALHFSIGGDPKGFDPLHSTEENGETIRYITGGVLVRVNRATDALEPMLAEWWKISDGGRTVTFHLKPGLKFSDGSPLSAKDVERTLRTALDPKQASPAGDTFRAGTADPEIRVISVQDISIRYPAPKPDLERLFDELAIVPGVELKPIPATAGPYFVAEYKAGSSVRLARNPYFQPQPAMESILLDIQPNREIELSRFLKGELQLIGNLTPEAFTRLKTEQPAAARNLGPGLGSEFLWFNQAPNKTIPAWKMAWFRSAAFRHAVSSAIHREDIVKLVFQGYAHPSAGPFSPANTFWFNKALRPRAYDPQAANAALKRDGFVFRGESLYDKDGHAVEFSLITNAGNKVRERMAAVIQDDLKQIGIRLNIVPLDFGSLLDRISKSYDYEACLLGFANVAIDPVEQNNVWLSSGAQHPWWPAQQKPATAWEAEIDKLMLAQSAEIDRAARKRAFDRVQQIALDEEPILYLVNRDFLAAVSPKLLGAQPATIAPQLIWNIERLRLE